MRSYVLIDEFGLDIPTLISNPIPTFGLEYLDQDKKYMCWTMEMVVHEIMQNP